MMRTQAGMARTWSRAGFGLLVAVSLWGLTAQEVQAFAPRKPANNKNNNNRNQQEARDDARIRQEQQDVKQAQEQLQKDIKEAHQLEEQLKKADHKQRLAQTEAQKVRDHVEAQHEKSSGIEKALQAQESAKKVYDETCAPVLAALRATPDYAQAQKVVTAAQARMKELRETKILEEAERQKQVGLASKQLLAVSQLEKSALEGDPKVRSARDKLTEAQGKVSALREKIRKDAERDPQLKTTLKHLDDAKSEVASLRTKLTALNGKIAQDRGRLAKEAVQLQQAQIADKANDNKPNPNSRKPGKK